MNKRELINWVRRKLGEPMVKVELHNSQIESCLYNARDEYIKWATGSATNEVFFTVALSAGVSEYELPSGVTEVVKVKEFDATAHGINTLFTTENYLYNQGMLSFLDNVGNYSIIDYHMALGFIDLLDKYTIDRYTCRYDEVNNKIRVRPTPLGRLTEEEIEELNITEVGYLIIHSFMLAGTDENTFTEINDSVYNLMWGKTWVQNYSLALSKEILGLIRRKFANFSSIGNAGISLDGDSLLSEAKEEKDRLEERLRKDEESETGFAIFMG